MPSLAFTADSRQTEAGRLYNRSEEDETRIPLQKAIDDADYEHGHRVHELDFLTAFRSPRLRQPPKRLDKRVPQDGIGARLGHPRPSLRCPGQPRAAGAPPRPPNPQDQLTSTADGSGQLSWSLARRRALEPRRTVGATPVDAALKKIQTSSMSLLNF